LGEFLSEIQATAGFRASTYTVYSQSLRQLVAEIAEIGDQPALGDNGQPRRDRRGRIIYLSRKHRESGGRDAWVAKVDQQQLDLLTPEAVQRWKLAYIARAGQAPDAVRRATNTAGAILRCARALFSDRALRYLKDKLMLPEPLPLAGLKIPKTNGTRYVSKIDARELIAAAQTGLAGEEFKIFALAALCGLRKREIDTLLWRQIDFTAGQLRIEPTEYFSPKSEDSIGTVDLDDELLALLRGWRAQSKGEFVVAPQQKPQRMQARSNYRCALHFRELYNWLRKQGVNARKPLHELRKELGAILASEQGIFAAQSVLRHAQISTTAAYYTDKKRRITAGLGQLLATASPKVIEGKFAKTQTAKNPRKRSNPHE
jgi:integrase